MPNTTDPEPASAGARQPAPGSLRLVEEFANTIDGDTEELRTPADLGAWCEARGLTRAGTAPDDAALSRARAVRSALRSLLLVNDGYPLDSEALRTLNEFSAGAPHELHFDGSGHAVLEPVVEGTDAALVRILLSVHEAMADGTWHRLKTCRSDTCEWVFYDSSKNRSASWCSMQVCGNRQKARRYRTRKRSGTADSLAAST